MKNPALLYNNAMLYKDITQWLRNKTFAVLFFGLLLFSEVVSLIVISIPGESAEAGLVSFIFFIILLCLYSLAITTMGYNHTAREFVNKTFELYELSGISLEKMVLGKFLSMSVQFLFGYFCVIPFMFFSYLLGGLDFVSIFGFSILLFLLAIPVFLGTLLLSFSSRFMKLSGIGRSILIIMLLLFILNLLGTLLGALFMSHSPLAGLSDLLKALFTFDPRVIGGILIFFVFYVQICLFLFYFCCHVISGANDSREMPLKILFFTLYLSWVGFSCWLMRKPSSINEEYFYLFYIPLFFILLIVGFLFFYNRMDVPLIVENRWSNARRVLRSVYFLFRPGAEGTARLVLIMLAVLILPSVFLYLLLSGKTGFDQKSPYFFNALSAPFQAPFFLAFPAGVLLCFKGMRKKMKEIRTLAVLWWIFVGVGVLIVYSFLKSFNRSRDNPLVFVIEIVSLLASPLSSFSVGVSRNFFAFEMGAIIRFLSGMLGLVFMYVIIRWRKRIEAS